MQYGVVCQEEEFGERDSWQLRLFFTADHLETDMTGLHLRFPEPIPAERRAAPVVREVVERLTADPELSQRAIAMLHNNEELPWLFASSISGARCEISATPLGIFDDGARAKWSASRPKSEPTPWIENNSQASGRSNTGVNEPRARLEGVPS